MSDLTPTLTPTNPSEPTRISAAQYAALAEGGVFAEDDRVELLEGVIVTVPPPNPPHELGIVLLNRALTFAVGLRAVVRPQCSLYVGRWSIPEPDFAVVPGAPEDYRVERPRTALLVAEVSDTSLQQDRLAKSRIFAAASIPEYWILNVRDCVLEVMRDPEPAAGVYREVRELRAGDTIEIAALPGAMIHVADLLPRAMGSAPEIDR